MSRRKYVEIGEEKAVARRGRSCWYVGKTILQVIAILASLVVIGLEIYLYVEWKDLYDQDVNSKIRLGLSAPAAAVVAWNLVDSITSCARGGRGIHPGVHVAVDLVLFLACGLIGAFCIVGAKQDYQTVNRLQDYINSFYNAGEYDDKNWSDYSQGDVIVLGKYVERTWVAGSILAVVAVIMFMLFLLACAQTHRRRQQDSHRRVRVPIIVTSAYEQTRAESVAGPDIPLTGINVPQPYDPVAPVPPGQPYRSQHHHKP